MSMKMVILMRTDLGMSSGKMAAQAAHAAVGMAIQLDPETLREWLRDGAKKVVVGVPSVDALQSIVKAAKKDHIPTHTVRDAGRTELEAGTLTCAAIGPGSEMVIDVHTSHLSLL